MADITLAASLCSTESSGLGDIWPKTSKTSRDSKVRSKESRYSRESSIVCEAPKDKWQRDPKLTLVAACDNCAIMDFEGGGPPYHGLDYQVKLQLLPLLEKRQGLQFRRVRRCSNPKGGSWLEIECGNEDTYLWLKENGNIPFSSNQTVLIRFYPANNRYKYLVVRLPLTAGINDKFSLELFRQRCQKQNPTLDTWHWRLVDRKRVHEGAHGPVDEARVLLLEVPEESLEYLKSHHWQLFYQLGKIHFEPILLSEEFVGDVQVRCCTSSFCYNLISFSKQNLLQKSFLSVCPAVVQLVQKTEEDDLSERSEQFIAATDLDDSTTELDQSIRSEILVESTSLQSS